VRKTHVDRQFQSEIPRRAILWRFDLHFGACTCCGRRVGSLFATCRQNGLEALDLLSHLPRHPHLKPHRLA
jgi:hypothetical protein